MNLEERVNRLESSVFGDPRNWINGDRRNKRAFFWGDNKGYITEEYLSEQKSNGDTKSVLARDFITPISI